MSGEEVSKIETKIELVFFLSKTQNFERTQSVKGVKGKRERGGEFFE